MVATLTAAPVVSLFAACAFCPVSTSFRCMGCDTAMCPDCCPGDFCPDCGPARPVALRGFSAHEWDTERQSYNADADLIRVACAACGDTFGTDDADETLCPRCSMGEAEFAALRTTPANAPRRSCQTCGATLYGTDGPRCTACARFIARLDAKHAAWKEERIAA